MVSSPEKLSMRGDDEVRKVGGFMDGRGVGVGVGVRVRVRDGLSGYEGKDKWSR